MGASEAANLDSVVRGVSSLGLGSGAVLRRVGTPRVECGLVGLHGPRALRLRPRALAAGRRRAHTVSRAPPSRLRDLPQPLTEGEERPLNRGGARLCWGKTLEHGSGDELCERADPQGQSEAAG